MSRYDRNPFDEADDSNPFSGTAADRQSAVGRSGNLGGEFATGSFYDTNPNNLGSRLSPLPHEGFSSATRSAEGLDDIPITSKELKRKEKELQAKEAALKRKEGELRRREAALGIETKNWPSCWPLIHHDIESDIPDVGKSIQYAAFYSWLGMTFCLVFNIVCVTALWASGAVSYARGIGNLILSILYLVIGVPSAFFSWYRPLYRAMRKDSAFSFALFFAFYLVHCIFSIFAALAPPLYYRGLSFMGLLSAVYIFTAGYTVVGILYFIGAAFFGLESLLSLYVISRVYFYFRDAGQMNRVRRETELSAISRI